MKEEILQKFIGDFIPYVYIERVYEPDFGCEGRTDEQALCDVVVYTKEYGKSLIRLEEEILWRNIFDDHMLLGYEKVGESFFAAVSQDNVVRRLNPEEQENSLVWFLYKVTGKAMETTKISLSDTPIHYRRIAAKELTQTLFSFFNRYQQVTHCWRKENGKWILEKKPFIEQWGEKEYAYLIVCLKRTLENGGTVFGAFCGQKLVGFCSLEGGLFGSMKQYMQLSSLHASYEMRRHGIGKTLFYMAAEEARRMGAKKLYISSQSSEETQAFYHSLGCMEAQEYSIESVGAEPCDCQLEYLIGARA